MSGEVRKRYEKIRDDRRLAGMFKPNDQVNHEFFGDGFIIGELMGGPGDVYATVAFYEVGKGWTRKTLHVDTLRKEENTDA